MTKTQQFPRFLVWALCGLLFFCSTAHAQKKTKHPVPKPVPVVEEEETPKVVASKEGYTIYTLSQAIQQALTIGPGIESATRDYEAAEAQYDEAKGASILPQVDLKILGGVVPDVPPGSGPQNNFPSVNTSWNDVGPFIQARMEGFQPIYTFGKLKNLRRAALGGVDAKNEGVRKAKNELIYQVKRAYISLASLYTLKDFLLELQDRAGKAKGTVSSQIQKKSSEVTDIDLMRIDVFQAETERRMIEVNNGIEFSTLALKVLMGLPRDAQIDIADQRINMDNTVIQSIDNYMEIAKENRPEIAQLKDLVDVRNASYKVAKSNFFPTLGIAGFYRYGWAPDRENVDNPFLVDDFHMNSGGGFLVLSQNLSFHMTRARSRQAVALYNKAIADQQYALQGIELEIRKAHTTAIAKQQAVDSAKRGFKSGRSWVLASTLNFGVGVATPKDLLEAFVGYSAVKINYLQTINEYHMALADLSNAVGKEVTGLTY